MLWTIVLVLVILWALGFFGGFVTGNAIHLLLVIVLVIIAVRLIRGERL